MAVDIKAEVLRLEAEFDKEMEELAQWTTGLNPEDRVGYMCFSLKQRIIQLRLKRRIANFQEQYELCAAINRHLLKLAPFLKNCTDGGDEQTQHGAVEDDLS